MSRGLAPTRVNYTFTVLGAYEFSQWSDYPEDEGEGYWNFTSTTGNTGVIFLDDGDALYFEFRADGSLMIGRDLLDACSSPAALVATTTNLLTVDPSDLYNAITGSTWYRTSPRDRDPAQLEFYADGTYVARFPDKNCVERSSWSLENDYVYRTVVARDCDGNERQYGATGGAARSILGHLIIGLDVYSASPLDDSSPGTTWVPGQFTEMMIVYERSSIAGQTSELRLYLSNVFIREMTYLEVSVEETGPGQSRDPSESDIVLRQQLGFALSPGDSQTIPIRLVFAEAGSKELTLRVRMQDNRQTFEIEGRISVEVQAP